MNRKRLQPKDGDTVLHCGHLGAGSWHWWHLPNQIGFRRPDKTEGCADWIVACEPCSKTAGFESLKISIQGDARWNGNEPVLPEPN